MYLDLISPYDNLSINLKLASLMNLNCAVYWAELLNVYSRVVKKKLDETLENDGFFDLDRTYVERRTTLPAETQLECDAAFAKLGVLTSDENDPNRIKLDVKKAISIIVEDDLSEIREIRKKTKLNRNDEKLAKRNGMYQALCRRLTEQDKDALEALKRWIGAMLDAKKPMNGTVVAVFQNALDSYTQDPKIKAQIADIAAIHAWPDFAWARDCFEKSYKNRNDSAIRRIMAADVDMSSGF